MSLLAVEDEGRLRDIEMAGKSKNRGMFFLHRCLLTRASAEEYRKIRPKRITKIDWADPIDRAMYAELPCSLLSEETYVYIGLNKDVARCLWRSLNKGKQRLSLPGTGPWRERYLREEFMLHARHFIRAFETFDAYNIAHDASWMTFFKTVGVNAELAEAIMDPVYRSVRNTQSALFWVLDSIEVRFRSLLEIRRSSEARAKAHQPGWKANLFPLDPMYPGPVLPSPETVTLYMGIDQPRLALASDHRDSRFLYRALQCSTDTNADFVKPQGHAIAFNLDVDVANMDACFAKRRSPNSPVVLLSVELPLAVLEGPNRASVKTCCSMDPLWKELVWHGKTGTEFTAAIEPFAKAILIIGTASTKPGKSYPGASHAVRAEHDDDDDDSGYHEPEKRDWDDIEEGNIRRTEDGSPVTQYVFPGEEGILFFGRNAAKSLGVKHFLVEEVISWHDSRAAKLA